MSFDSTKPHRTRQKRETRGRILAQAKRLCAERGFARTRTADVARAAGVSHGSVFVHFGSREDLVLAVVSEMTREISDALHARVSSGATLRETLAAHLECLADREAQVRWLLIETPGLPMAFRSAWLSLQSAVSFHLAQAAVRDMAAGRIRGMSLHLLFNTWTGLIHHYVVNRDLFAPGRSVLRVHGPALLDHFDWLVSVPAPAIPAARSSRPRPDPAAG